MVVLNVQRDCLDSCNIVSTKITQEKMANTKITQEDGMVRYPTLSDLSVTSRSTSALISWATPECFPRFEIAVKKVKALSILFSSSQEQVEECGGLESCKEMFDSLELLDLADDDVQTQVDDLAPCTQYVAFGRTIGGHWSVDPVLFTGCNLQVRKGKEPCYTKCSGRNQHLMMLTTRLRFQTSEPSLLGELQSHL